MSLNTFNPPTSYIVVSKDEKNLSQKINETLLLDYEEFKLQNELLYCSFKQNGDFVEPINVIYSTTRKYNGFDLKKINRDFNLFVNDNKESFCTISKITNQDHTTIVEYSVLKNYYFIREEE